MRQVVLPEMNAVNLSEDLPEEARADMTFHLVAGIKAALARAFEGELPPIEAAALAASAPAGGGP